jgi:hypothetical protein
MATIYVVIGSPPCENFDNPFGWSVGAAYAVYAAVQHLRVPRHAHALKKWPDSRRSDCVRAADRAGRMCNLVTSWS